MSILVAIIFVVIVLAIASFIYGGIIFLIFNTFGLSSAIGIGQIPIWACLAMGLLLSLITSKATVKNKK